VRKHCFGRTAAGLAYSSQDLKNRVYERERVNRRGSEGVKKAFSR